METQKNSMVPVTTNQLLKYGILNDQPMFFWWIFDGFSIG